MPFWLPLFGGVALGVWGYKKIVKHKEGLKELVSDPKGAIGRWNERQEEKYLQRGLKLLEEEKREKEGN